MSRPASRKAKPRGKSAKPKKKTPKQQIAELTELNETLTKELDSLKTDASGMIEKIDNVTTKLVNSVRKTEFGIGDDTNLQMLHTATLLSIIEKLRVQKQVFDVSVESRVAELESRLTTLSMDAAKMTTKATAYESGLGGLVDSNNIDEIKDKIFQLQLIAGQEYHTFSANDPLKTPRDLLNGYYDEKPDSATMRSLENANLLNLTPPKKKFAGETPLRSLHKELRLYIIQELSQEKASGSDWRRFAERVEIEQSQIEQWRMQKIKYPMANVLRVWEKSPSATARILHRHLVSPQMRCTLVAKRVMDFYNVD